MNYFDNRFVTFFIHVNANGMFLDCILHETSDYGVTTAKAQQSPFVVTP